MLNSQSMSQFVNHFLQMREIGETFIAVPNSLKPLNALESGPVLPAAMGFLPFYPGSFSLEAESPAKIQFLAPLLVISFMAWSESLHLLERNDTKGSYCQECWRD